MMNNNCLQDGAMVKCVNMKYGVLGCIENKV